jgi:apolipoprotein N-acyltransferase
MKRVFSKITISLALGVLSGIMLYSIFPPLELSFLAWIVLVPVLIPLCFQEYPSGFLMTVLMGVTLSTLHIQWLTDVPGFPISGLLLITVFAGIFFGLFGIFFLFFVKHTDWPIILFGPVLWVAIEYFRSNLSFLSMPWGLLGHSQFDRLAIIQISSITSVYGISFLIVIVNCALAQFVLWVINRYNKIIFKCHSSKIVFISAIIGLSALVIVYFFGNYQVKKVSKNKNGILTASLIQGNIPQEEKWDPKFRSKILARYRKLTLEASQENPDLIIWPESATPGYLENKQTIYQIVKNLSHKIGIPILLGSASHAKIKRGEKKIKKLKNGAFLMDSNGRIVAKYYKMKLLPFAEYLPLEGRLPWPRWLVPQRGYFIPGKKFSVFKHPKGRFGVVICWENLFPNLFRKFVTEGSQFMVNLTNEAWFGKTVASKQIISMSVFRAVENRVSLLRVANTGISALIDPLGRIQKRVLDENGNDVMVTGIITVLVPGPIGETFYTEHGDLFAITCTFVTTLMIVMALLPAKVREFLIKQL